MKIITTYRIALWLLIACVLSMGAALKRAQHRAAQMTSVASQEITRNFLLENKSAALQAENAQLRHNNKIILRMLLQCPAPAPVQPPQRQVVVRHLDGTVVYSR